jgi:S-adenosylmethionine synthetase
MKMLTAESVCEGHPDKMGDLISDSVLDAYLAQDPYSRVACEVMINSSGTCVVAGEVTSKAKVDIEALVYVVWPECKRVLIDLQPQYPALAATVLQGGANDQGVMVGFACDETSELMPMPITLAHRVTRRLAEVRKSGLLPYLRADGKAQVTVVYENGEPIGLGTVVVSVQHDEQVLLGTLREDIFTHILSGLPLLTETTKVLINRQAGRFEISADTGLTGRKIVMDAYGPQVPDGGGAFSGKDPSKLDRSGAYMLRHVAKQVVVSGRATRCKIEAAYCIGVAEPVALHVDAFGTGKSFDIEAYVRTFPLTPEGIIEYLDLRKPIYKQTACYGHFGNAAFPWEKN